MKFPRVEHKTTVMRGGLDLVTPTLSIRDGVLVYSLNYECTPVGGYGRLKGYERVDGRAAPSAGMFSIVEVSNMINVPTVGQTLTGFTSSVTGVVSSVGSNFVAVTKTSGSYTLGETLKVGATVIGTYIAQDFALSGLQNAQFLNDAATQYRNDITAVGGAACSGGVLGVFVYNDIVYAFRNNAAGTAATLWQATVGGWVQIVFLNEISFTAGGAAIPVDGAILTQGAVTATVRRIMMQTGAWAGSTAAGRFIITNPAGGNFAAGLATIGAVGVTLSGVQTAITMLPNGKFETVLANFAGQASTIRTYGCDGVNRAWEFDGSYFCPITTGASPDKPKHIVAHRSYLMVSINSSLLYSEVVLPYRWATGGEIAVGDIITGLLEFPGAQTTGALGVYCRQNMYVLYGTAPASWNLGPINVGSGAFEYSIQNFGQTFFFNSDGVTSFQTSLNYGNFVGSTVTEKVNNFIVQEERKVSCSSINRQKNQYRIFFNEGYGLYITLTNNQLLGCMPVFFPSIVNVAWESELSTGLEVSYFGCTDGFVYQADKGTSFDGANIDAVLSLNWDAMGQPRILKTYKKASVEVKSDSYAAIQFSYQLGYGSNEIDFSPPYTYDTAIQGATYWDVFTWDIAQFDGNSQLPVEIGLTGTGENIQVTIASSTPYIDSYVINSIVYHYINRRALR